MRQRTPSEVLEFARDHKDVGGGRQVSRFPGHVAALQLAHRAADGGFVPGRVRVRRIEHTRVAEHQRERHARDPRSIDGLHGSVHQGADAHLSSATSSTPSRASATRGTRARSGSARRTTSRARGSPTSPATAPRRSSSSSTTCGSIRKRTWGTTTSIRRRGAGTPAATKTPTSPTSRVTKKDISPFRRRTSSRISARR